MTMLRNAAGAMLALGALLLIAPPANAETIKLPSMLDGRKEVPPIQSTAGGPAAMTLDTATRLFTWAVSFKGLSGGLRAAHFHGPASATENAPIVIPIGKLGDKSPLAGSKVLTPDQATDRLAGRWYINIHAAAHPPGEIRGQVVKQ